MRLGWYLKRLGRMSPAELLNRARDAALKTRWTTFQVRQGMTDRLPSTATPHAPKALPAFGPIAPEARAALVAAANALLEGHWPAFALERADFGSPDWFLDPTTGIRAPDAIFAFRYPHRDPSKVGNLKYVWEASRHQHLTVLAAAYSLTRDNRYAERVARDLRDWWRSNPFLSGPHWISGIELGMRLISWTWCRRLLGDWPGAAELFERNPDFQVQLFRHQQFLDAFRSAHSSANNHVIAEAAGQLTAAAAFPLFAESARWRNRAAALLRKELRLQTFPSGLNRELASEYHGFVLELCLVAALECEASAHPIGAEFWTILRDMTDVLAASVDTRRHPPRQGDADDGIGLLLDAPDFDRWTALLRTGAEMFGRAPWWPELPGGDVRSALLAALARPPTLSTARPPRAAALAQDAGMVLLRAGSGEQEIWCRCDSGPHGFLSTAAHAHADALSVELRIGGVEILADIGTYCYHTHPAWRRFFRSTAAHNTVELFGKDQSLQSGPFMWSRHAKSRLIALEGMEDGEVATWTAEHDGYAPHRHRRSVSLSRSARTLRIDDTIFGGGAPGRLTFILGPAVQCALDGAVARLSWAVAGRQASATLHLPPRLSWRVSSGREEPIEGWYSASFGRKQPSVQLTGEGSFADGEPFTTLIEVHFDA